jgi:type IV secretion system protein VirD4
MSLALHAEPSTAQGLRVLGENAPESIGLGRYVHPDEGITNKLRYNGERHALVFGPNGSGKSMRLFVPNLLQMSGKRSLVVLDPKGELAAMTAPFRRTVGRVVVLNPFGVFANRAGYEDLRSEGFNPLANLDPLADDFDASAALVAEAMIPVKGNDPYWDLSARTLVSALAMFTVLEARGMVEPFAVNGRQPPRGVATMARLRELLCQPSAYHDEPVGLPALAEQMAQCEFVGLRNKAGQFTEWQKDIQSVVRTAMQHTECFDDAPISRDMAGGFDFAEIKREPVTVYLTLPPKMVDRHAKWLRLCLTAALNACMRPREAGEPRVLFMIDEFAALGRMSVIETAWAQLRGYGVQMMPVLQDLNQLKALYGDRWESFLANAGAVVSFGTNDRTTADWLSQRMGDTTRTAENRSRSYTLTSGSSGTGNNRSSNAGSSFSDTTSQNGVKVPLMSPQQLYGLQEGYAALMLAGLPSVVPSYIPAWWEITQCLARVRDNPFYAAAGTRNG